MTADTKPLRFLRLHEVRQKVGLHKTQIYGLMAEKKFPAAVKLTAGTVGWIEHEIDDWIRDRIAVSRPGAEPIHFGGPSGGSSRQRAGLRVVQS